MTPHPDLVALAVTRLRDVIPRGDVPMIDGGLLLGQQTPPSLPAVLVWLGEEAATESLAPSVGAYQRLTATLIVAHVIGAPNSARGEKARDPMAQIVAHTRAALNGWRPVDSPGQRDTLALRRGRLTALEGARALWQDEYRISWRAVACP
ncbi:phage tail terminator protein [Tateyamaria sp.]|uniref:phage tail terminator protein n=1 Tax=Tateyamaria sp. TaxID=1929288 RepID=UPI003B219427